MNRRFSYLLVALTLLAGLLVVQSAHASKGPDFGTDPPAPPRFSIYELNVIEKQAARTRLQHPGYPGYERTNQQDADLSAVHVG